MTSDLQQIDTDGADNGAADPAAEKNSSGSGVQVSGESMNQ